MSRFDRDLVLAGAPEVPRFWNDVPFAGRPDPSLRVQSFAGLVGHSLWEPAPSADYPEVALVSEGGWRYRADGDGPRVIDRRSVVWRLPGRSASLGRIGGMGYRVDVFRLSPDQVALAAPILDRDDPTTRLSIEAALQHADVIAVIRRRCDQAEVEGAVDRLVWMLIADARAQSAESGPASRVALVDRVRIGHAVHPGSGLGELTVGIASLGHVSRSFHQGTGMSFREYRAYLRAITTIRRLANGAVDDGGLTALAARVGYADHAHLTRSVRKWFGHSPVELSRRFDGDIPITEQVN